jgi:hypothetical protein
MTNKDDIIYTEDEIIIIRPLKARIFSDDFEKEEFYSANGKKVILLREKQLEK